MEIIRTTYGDENFYLFEDLPEQLYPAKNITEDYNTSFVYSYYVLLDNAQPKARAVLYQNPGLFYQGETVITIGNYECVENDFISSFFLAHLIKEAKKLNPDYLIGPMNGSTWDHYRFSLHNDFENFLLEPYHPVYYNHQFQSAGFRPVAHYSSRINTDFFSDEGTVLLKEKRLFENGLKLRNIDLDNFDEELKKLYPFVNAAFKNNFLFSTIAMEVFVEKYKKIIDFINPEFVLIAEDEKENIIGFIFCYEDLLNKKEKSLVIKTLARDQSKKWSGLGAVMANRIIVLAKERGYKSVIHAFMMDDGSSSESSRKFFGNVYKEYVLYGLKL
ncbi:MAG: hypothetical protein ABJA32_02025 [Ginsengibacter sp.]|jgi:hypothetical protein